MRLIDAEAQWVEKASDNTDYVLAYANGIYCLTDDTGRVMCEFIHDSPTVDTVEVVRCGGCKFRNLNGDCDHPRIEGYLTRVYPMDYCSYGERKDETHENC